MIPSAPARPLRTDENGLPDEVLLQICRVRKKDQVTPEWMETIRAATHLLEEQRVHQDTRVEASVTLLASALGQLKQYNPTHYPFGYAGEVVQSAGWIDRDALERIGKQIVGLMWRRASAETVAAAVQHAVSESIRLGFLDQREYDAWRPGMRSGSGWRWAVTATPYGVTRVLGLIETAHGDNPVSLKSHAAATSDQPGTRSDPADVADHGAKSECLGQAGQNAGLSVMRFAYVPLVQGVTDGITAAAPAPSRNPRSRPRRGARAANIEILEKEMEKHLLAARDHAHSLRDRGREPVLLPRPTQKELAQRTGLSESDVSRCLKDPRATVLKILWETAESLEAVMKYKWRH